MKFILLDKVFELKIVEKYGNKFKLIDKFLRLKITAKCDSIRICV